MKCTQLSFKYVRFSPVWTNLNTFWLGAFLTNPFVSCTKTQDVSLGFSLVPSVDPNSGWLSLGLTVSSSLLYSCWIVDSCSCCCCDFGGVVGIGVERASGRVSVWVGEDNWRMSVSRKVSLLHDCTTSGATSSFSARPPYSLSGMTSWGFTCEDGKDFALWGINGMDVFEVTRNLQLAILIYQRWRIRVFTSDFWLFNRLLVTPWIIGLLLVWIPP